MSSLVSSITSSQVSNLRTTGEASRNLVTSSGHVGEKFLAKSKKQYYRGIELNTATAAASKMLQKGSLNIRFGIFGEEEEILELLSRAGHGVSIEEISLWVKSGGEACCLVADRDDDVVAACRVHGIRGATAPTIKDGNSQQQKIATFDHLSLPLDSTGDRFLAKAVAMSRGWGCTSIHIHMPAASKEVVIFLTKTTATKFVVVSSEDLPGDVLRLTLV